MDELRDRFHHGRRDMIDAFVRVSDFARRAGVDEDDILAAHGQFFDGNVETKATFRVAILLASIRKPGSAPAPS